ncbi:hypothetical protein QQY24_13095 [Streptomyces sp. TG1A-8]|uniref:hypothetical protein n=1 Tax=Streptomyces sp. TG1A-8 TaxID=3051385 RepID=UPI00265BAC82|nr:hypothetical protein [Streptomyces sp. TG1A-8]MDO0926313.1 hypothetical protein [Streptomyces sp. TG1A-8]
MIVASFVAALMGSAPAHAFGGSDTRGEVQGDEVSASAHSSRIKVTQQSGPTGGRQGTVSPTDVNWKPPPCWYEPVFSPAQLKDFAENDGDGDVGLRDGWYGTRLWTDHFKDGKDATSIFTSPSTVKGYKDYNLGKNGYFWRGVAPDVTAIDDTSLCSRLMFWVDAGEVPDVPNAPTPKTLAEYAYDRIKVPSTEIEVRPQTRSTVNLPAWVWLDKGRFKEVRVRAELPDTGLWAETTAEPVALHLDPGTPDAVTQPPSGDCTINSDGSIGTPYTRGDADRTPPCGITYLRASNGGPYRLRASLTWRISWKGSDGSGGDLPDGTFPATRDMAVQEIQSVNR